MKSVVQKVEGEECLLLVLIKQAATPAKMRTDESALFAIRLLGRRR